MKRRDHPGVRIERDYGAEQWLLLPREEALSCSCIARAANRVGAYRPPTVKRPKPGHGSIQQLGVKRPTQDAIFWLISSEHRKHYILARWPQAHAMKRAGGLKTWFIISCGKVQMVRLRMAECTRLARTSGDSARRLCADLSARKHSSISGSKNTDVTLDVCLRTMYRYVGERGQGDIAGGILIFIPKLDRHRSQILEIGKGPSQSYRAPPPF